MKKIFLFFFIFLILLSCQNCTDNNEFTNNVETPCMAKCIVEAFSYFITHFEEDTNTSNYYALEFQNGVPEFGLLDDTAICFYKIRTEFYDGWIKDSLIDSYKGIMMINQRQLVVFDENDVGKQFYKNNCLEYIDLDSLEFPSSEEFALEMMLVLDDGKYLQWYDVKPDDWSPIKI